MAAPEVLTYNSLVSDITNYAERASDAVFVAQIPRIIMLAENRIASEVRGLGFVRTVQGTLAAGQSYFAKPERWRETKSFSFLVPSNNRRVYLRHRKVEYCQAFWPNAALTAQPRFYADYDYEHFLLAATPDQQYAFVMQYYERPAPLSNANQTSWTTQYAPQLLLYASLLEAMPFLKNSDRLQEFQALYTAAKAAVNGEDMSRAADTASTQEKV